MPLGLLSLAASLKNRKIAVKIYEPKIRLIKDDDYRHAATDILSANPDIIGFSTWCITYAASLLLAKEIKKLSPGTIILFGGPQASIVSQRTLEEFEYIDYVLSGEADYTLPSLIEELHNKEPKLSTIQGLTYRNKSGDIVQIKIADLITNLDDLPMPDYKLVSKHKYIKLDVGRGCPFHCTYCSTNDFFSKKYRVKSATRIIKEMLFCNNQYGTESFGFAHDMFTLNKKFVLELCEKLINIKHKKGIEFKWACSARIDCVTDEMLLKMKQAGCKSVFFGIESGSLKIQKSIQKNVDPAKALAIADLCRNIGLEMYASFIIGFPDETPADINKTLQLIVSLAVKGVFTQISDLALLPGTQLFEVHKNKLKFDGRFSNFSHALCGPLELELIIKNPLLFSSFYYLSLKTLIRKEIVFLCKLINKLRQYSNTLFLISEQLQHDIIGINLLRTFKSEYKSISTGKHKEEIIDSHWIRIISNYLNNNRYTIKHPYTGDIFSYEAHVALLKTIYTSWQLVHPQKNKPLRIEIQSIIKPTPVWRIISSLYKLEKTIPSENGWENNSNKFRKGKYYYLLVAVSENKCKRIQINEREIFLLENLSELSFRNYVQKVKQVASEKEILLWLKRMRRRGVVECIEPK